MPISSGRGLLAMPGPTNVPDSILAAMHRPAVDIYGGELVEHTYSCLADLKTLFATTGRAYMYIANGHGAWEASLSNVLSRGDEVLVLSSGMFADAWGNMAGALGIEVSTLSRDGRRAVRSGCARGAAARGYGRPDQGVAGQPDRHPPRA